MFVLNLQDLIVNLAGQKINIVFIYIQIAKMILYEIYLVITFKKILLLLTLAWMENMSDKRGKHEMAY